VSSKARLGPSSEAGPRTEDLPTPTAPGAPGRGTALNALAGLSVKGRAPKTGYDRDLFGSGWTDTDHNSCTTREDVLRRDLRPVTVLADTEGCEVVAGTLVDPYTGGAIAFTKGVATSGAVQIDHVVSLSDAWQKGAQQWTADQRVVFANHLLELLATDGPTNAAKSDSDSASWLPPDKSYRCTYVARQISIKAQFGLWVTSAEKAAMQRVLTTCPGQPLITSAAAAARKSPTATVRSAGPVTLTRS
jgi:hypothetical protein